MALFGGINKKSTLKASIAQTENARKSEGAKAHELFKSAYQGFSDVVKGDLVVGEALYNWGFALLHEAKSKNEEEGVQIYLESISKFTFCLLVSPNHLGAAIDGGVAYMDLSRIMQIAPDDELYDLAGEFFANAERIQRGSAAYNLACMYALRGQKEACLEALELSRECGSLPKVDDIIDDVDMAGVKNAAWFTHFMGVITTKPEPAVVDDSVVVYDVEGNVINKNPKKKGFENEVDGVLYDAEGNVLNAEELEETSEPSPETEIDSADTATTEIDNEKVE
ncbi:MAG: hypothetical protein KAG19_08055 [Methylococcales bacterium]|nr:hypothetical protein [Methylococcales bacterium]